MPDSLRIRTRSVTPVVGPELTESVNQRLASVYGTDVERTTTPEPAAAGFVEIAYTIIVTGAAGLIFKFFEPLVTAAGEAYRDEVFQVIRGGRRSKRGNRGYIPLGIEFGAESSAEFPNTPVRYYFHGSMDEQQLLERLEAANAHIRTIPEEHFERLGGPQEHGFFWDVEQAKWRGSIGRYPEPVYGEFWVPPRVFDPDEE